MPAAPPTRCSPGCCGGCEERRRRQIRLADDFATDPIWDEGLGLELDASLTAFRALWETVEMIADRLAEGEGHERRTQMLQELRGAMRRLEARPDGLNRTLRPAGGGVPTVRWMERSARGAAA